MLTEIQINEMLEAAKPSIINGFKEEISKNITWEIREKAAAVIQKEVEAWVKENVIPEVLKGLTERKEGFIGLGVEFGQQAVQLISQSMTDTLKKKLESSWERKKIFTAMMD